LQPHIPGLLGRWFIRHGEEWQGIPDTASRITKEPAPPLGHNSRDQGTELQLYISSFLCGIPGPIIAGAYNQIEHVHLIAIAREGLFIDLACLPPASHCVWTWGRDPVSGRMQCDSDGDWLVAMQALFAARRTRQKGFWYALSAKGGGCHVIVIENGIIPNVYEMAVGEDRDIRSQWCASSDVL
jgi:hypothetical protein